MRSNVERLRDIKDSIFQIERYASQGIELFQKDELVQAWVVHHLQIIGEAARAVEPDFQSQYPQIPWSDIVGLRNVLVHQYFRIDEDMVWSIIKNNLPDLNMAVEAVLTELDGIN